MIEFTSLEKYTQQYLAFKNTTFVYKFDLQRPKRRVLQRALIMRKSSDLQELLQNPEPDTPQNQVTQKVIDLGVEPV